jgi:ABC-type dipeptide/oligopeptide/nickel transport system permease component
MGLDKPLLIQFGKFLGETVTGRWGNSWITRQPVLREICDHLRPTLFLGSFASMYSIAVALLLNALAFAFPRLGMPLIPLLRLGIAVPSFVVAIAVVLATTGFQSWLMNGLALSGDSAVVFVLPALAVALYPACVMTAVLRDRFTDILVSPFLRAARASGSSLNDLFFRVLLPNSWPTLLAAWVNQISLIVFSTIIVEYVFSFRGIGSLLIRSIQGKDLPVISGIILINGFFFLVIRSFSNLFSGLFVLETSRWNIKPEEVPSP